MSLKLANKCSEGDEKHQDKCEVNKTGKRSGFGWFDILFSSFFFKKCCLLLFSFFSFGEIFFILLVRLQKRVSKDIT